MTEKRFHYDYKTGRFKDNQSNSCATSNMRVLETQINNACYNYEKKIKELKKENERLKSDNFNLNKSVECLDETVKEQCNKLDWADECGVEWNEEYNEWIGE